MRRFRRSRRSVRTRWLDGFCEPYWAAIAAENYASGLGLTSADLLTPTQVNTDLDGRGTVVRVVGQLYFRNFSATSSVVVAWGLRVVDNAIGMVTSAEKPIFPLGEGASLMGPWLHVRYVYLPVNDNWAETQCWNGGAQSLNPEVDISVRRKLRQDQSLTMYMNAWNATDGSGFEISPVKVMGQLRVLARLG